MECSRQFWVFHERGFLVGQEGFHFAERLKL